MYHLDKFSKWCNTWLQKKKKKINDKTQKTKKQENYGKKETSSVAVVKSLYREIGLETIFADYEEESKSSISKMIEESSLAPPRAIFDALFNKIYKRSK